MTKAIPSGAPRRRQARVCVRCRSMKLHCQGAEATEGDEDCIATVPCKRCKNAGLQCEFVKSKRKGRPRRLPKPGSHGVGGAEVDQLLEMEVEAEEEEEVEEQLLNRRGEGSSSGSATTNASSTPETSVSPPSSSSFTSGNNQTTSLATRYFQEIHPWLPLFPSSLSLVTSLLESSVHLCFALTTLLSSPTPVPVSFEAIQLSPTIVDTQAALLIFYFLYGIGEPDKARPFMNWIYETIKEKGWYHSGRELEVEGVERELVRRVYWEASTAEILFSVTSGVRDLKIQSLNPKTIVTEEDVTLFGQTTFPLKIRSLSLLRDLMDPSLRPTPTEYSSVISIAQSFISTSSTYFSSSSTSLPPLPSLPTTDLASLHAADEQSFWSYMISSASLVNILCSSASYASSGFLCGVDSTNVHVNPPPSLLIVDNFHLVETRSIILSTSLSVFSFLQQTLSTPFATRPHSPFYGCILMMAATGLLASSEGNRQDGSIPVTIEELRKEEESLRLLRENTGLALEVLRDQGKKWKSAEKVSKVVEGMRVSWFVSEAGELERDIAEELIKGF